MSLYKKWTDFVVEYVKENGEDAFWNEYGTVEEEIYKKMLSSHSENVVGIFNELCTKFETSNIFFMGFLDGLNDSLKTPLVLEEIRETSELTLIIDYEKLYFNMLDAKADYLYSLPQWEGIFSPEKRKEIKDQWKKSKIVVNENKVGRNDPCPCGSGKKYKKCCGKNA